ncbi:MAG: membrane dipeptidase [Planctomycetota bacterium]|nr:membrane dipeptidase [Planctomycetota bacterium]
MLVDAHLDLAYNAVRGRAVTQPASSQTPNEDGTPSVSLPDLRNGQVNLICGTLFCMPHLGDAITGYKTPDQAHAAAKQQLHWYHQQEQQNEIRIIRHATDLPQQTSVNPRVIVLMEGADPIRTPAETADWFNAGVRAVGLAWKQTRYAGGTANPGPLTPDGIQLVHALDALHIIHDLSHLAEQSFWQLLDIASGPVMASHSNCRDIVPTDRQLSDDMIRALASRGGVIGINFYDRFLLPPSEYGTRRASLADVVHHIQHICDLTGNANHVAIGTDMDGGFGAECLPSEIRTSADLPRLADTLSASGFTDAHIHNVLAGNWTQFFQRSVS